jgi:hypothetical protein
MVGASMAIYFMWSLWSHVMDEPPPHEQWAAEIVKMKKSGKF